MVGIYHINFFMVINSIIIYNYLKYCEVDHRSILNYQDYLYKNCQHFNYLFFNFSIFLVNSTNVVQKE